MVCCCRRHHPLTIVEMLIYVFDVKIAYKETLQICDHCRRISPCWVEMVFIKRYVSIQTGAELQVKEKKKEVFTEY